MVMGHYGLGLILKRVEPRISLGWLLFGVAFTDILLGMTLLAGWEQAASVPGRTTMLSFNYFDYPYSHSLLGAFAAALAGMLAYQCLPGTGRSAGLRPALVFGVAILSHVLLDMIAHTPDITLAPGIPTRIGLGLWNNIPATAAVEGAIFMAGLGLYLSSTRSSSWKDQAVLAVMLLIALGFHVWSFSLFLVPSVTELALLMLFLQPAYALMGGYVDALRNRTSR